MESSPFVRFLARQKHIYTDSAQWPGGITLDVHGYLSAESPPAELVSSVRAIVLREDSVLIMTNLDGDYILPGGRVEKGETFEEALRRELLEEAGVEFTLMGRIGFMHLRHTSPKPENYPYLYPDFIWPIWAASFAGFRPQALVDDGYDVSFRFVPLSQVDELRLDDHERAFLAAALAMRT